MNWRMLAFVMGGTALLALYAPEHESLMRIVLKCIFILAIGNALQIGRKA